ncbi:Ger(x)C family spore germination C-terminal domain-containing protein [Paenibacillus montanisoli]|uniref:Ger(x)C family spore germination C-terminal domain-containing protein n=1 Tax=Paenibacillus montanisoli TaxID=2081970 RepID=UPI0014037BB5|nr:Ger(x)C family spore germination C-terminal domain-containing protein [Paenibacillus montanisoli]
MLEHQPPLEHSTASALREMTDLHSILDVPIKSLAQMLAGKSGAAALPLVVILPPGQPTGPNQRSPYVKGSAVFKKGRMIGRIDEDVTKSVLLLRNEMRMNTVTFTPKEGHGLVSLALKSKTKLLPRIKDGQNQD